MIRDFGPIGGGVFYSEISGLLLAERGYDPVYGARPLTRVIQRDLQTPLASLVLDGKIGALRHASRTPVVSVSRNDSVDS